MKLSAYTNTRDNNFNLIRFLAAFLVLLSHSFILPVGRENADPLYAPLGMSFGSIAVDTFFATSGFLVTGSLLARKNILEFVWARVLRIYPALVAAVLFYSLIVGAYFTTLSAPAFFSNPDTYKFIYKNISLLLGLKLTLPGVFDNVPYASIVNGSLWTLPWEIKMYIVLAVVGGVVFVIKKRPAWFSFASVVTAIAAVSLLFHIANHAFMLVDRHKLTNVLRFTSLFFTGSAFYALREKIPVSHGIAAIMAVVLAASLIEERAFFTVYHLTITYLVLYLAYVPSGKIRLYNKIGDYSYGIYIYAFPVQQSVVSLMPDVTFQNMLIISSGLTLFLAVLSWHLIEKNFLKMKSKHVELKNYFSNAPWKKWTTPI